MPPRTAVTWNVARQRSFAELAPPAEAGTRGLQLKQKHLRRAEMRRSSPLIPFHSDARTICAPHHVHDPIPRTQQGVHVVRKRAQKKRRAPAPRPIIAE